MSRSLARALAGLIRGLTAPMSSYKGLKTRLMVSENLAQVVEVGSMKFYSPTARSTHDTNSLLADGEPETIRWLDSLPEGDILWDIGANVGAFTIYGAVKRKLRVLAFEPSAASFATLTTNIELNGLEGAADAFCLAFSDETKLDYLHMANTGAGHSMHAFGTSQTVDGIITPVFRQVVPGYSADDFVKLFHVPEPQHIKLDVDSIEFSILKGAQGLLKKSVKSLLVEVDGLNDGNEIRTYLGKLGFLEVPDSSLDVERNVVFRKD